MYVTIGCCAPTSDLGYPAEIQLLSGLLVKGAPFVLQVQPAAVDQTRCVAAGKGLLGGLAGERLILEVRYRDQFNNPSTVSDTNRSVLTASLVDITSGDVMPLAEYSVSYQSGGLSVAYSLLAAGRFNLSMSLSLDGGLTSVPVVGSPFSVQISPVRPEAANTVCRGVGLRQAHIQRSASFEVQLYDTFRNNLVVGGDRLFVRLLGDARFHAPSLAVAPQCSDTQNGRYVCTYTPRHNGSHELVIRLLNNSADHPGGAGLYARYYSSADGAVGASEAFVSQQVDPLVRFSWPDGLLVPANHSSSGGLQAGTSGGKVPLSLTAGQSVRWSGYLVAPRSDSFRIVAAVENLKVTVFLDSVLLFDSWQGLANSVSLVADSSYALTVIASREPTALSEGGGVSIDLRWSTAGVREHTVPTFFLFDSAKEVALSPFPVRVD
jgi:hypothetical protein